LIVTNYSTAGAQQVTFNDPIITVNSNSGKNNVTETYIRVAMVDPGKPVNGVYMNLDSHNGNIDFKLGETIQISGLNLEYFSGNMLNISLLKGNVAKIPPDREFLNIDFLGKQKALYHTDDLEDSQIKFGIPSNLPTGNYIFVLVTGEEELHYYIVNARLS
jgi:hypothetical protein